MNAHSRQITTLNDIEVYGVHRARDPQVADVTSQGGGLNLWRSVRQDRQIAKFFRAGVIPRGGYPFEMSMEQSWLN